MKEDKTNDLIDDLMTVLESHIDEMGIDELFYNAFKLMTFSLYETMDNHKLSLKTMRAGLDEGMHLHLERKKMREHGKL